MQHPGDATAWAEADENDDAAAPRDHRARGGLSREAPRRLYPEPVHCPPARHRDLLRCGGELTTGVVHDGVDRPEPLDGRVYDARDVFRLPKVGGNRKALAAETGYLALRVVERLAPPSAHDDLGSGPRQLESRGPADARTTSRDERYGSAIGLRVQNGARHARTLPFPSFAGAVVVRLL